MNSVAIDLRRNAWIIAISALAAGVAVLAPQVAMLAALGLAALIVVGIWLLRQQDNWVTVFLVACLCLPPLPLALGDSGPHPALAAAAIGLVALVANWRRLGASIPRSSLALPLYALALVASLPFAVWFSGPGIAVASIARAGLFSIAVLVLFYTLAAPFNAISVRNSMRLIYGGAVVAAAFAIADFTFQFPTPGGFGAQYVWISARVYRRAQGLFYESSTLANFSVFFLMFGAACLAHPKNAPVPRRWLALGSVLFLATLVLSFSRAAAVALLVSLATLAFVQGSRRFTMKFSAGLAAASAAMVAALMLLTPAVARFYVVRMLASLQQALSGNERALSGRAETWRFLTSYLANHPQYAVFGVGYKTLPYSDFIGQTTVADNSYLGALVETGLVGLVALLMLQFAVLRLGWKARGNLYGLWFFSFWCGEALQMFFGDLFTYWRVLPLYFWVLAIAWRMHQSESRGSASP